MPGVFICTAVPLARRLCAVANDAESCGAPRGRLELAPRARGGSHG